MGDTILDPFAGTGTAAIVAQQMHRHSIAIDIDPANVACIRERVRTTRPADDVMRYYDDYRCTENLASIWGTSHDAVKCHKTAQPDLVY